jgi:4-diphosphocytidyl-2-C-methyl-D-erythritol kinase
MNTELAKRMIEAGFESFEAPAKINLFLHLIGRRQDGYHLMQSVFRLIQLHDIIYLKVREDSQIQRINAHQDIPEKQDLAVRAALLLQSHAQVKLGVDIAIDKQIPLGAGLGGGSSDAATVLIALNDRWKLGLSRQELMRLGLTLGADVPFFIFGQSAWAEGIGENLTALPLSPASYLVLTPKIHVSTAEIFNAKELTRDTFPTTIAAFSEMQGWDDRKKGVKNGDLSNQNLSQTHFRNDLENVVCQRYPVVNACLEILKQHGEAKMSGSGASVFLEKRTMTEVETIRHSLPAKIENTDLFCFSTLGLDQHPLYNLTPR